MPLPRKNRLNWLRGGGEMEKLIVEKDWSATPLGPIENWPLSLRTTVSLCLSSNFPINIVWGPEAIQIYNDGYRVVCGEVHPKSLGEPYPVTWASAWPAIGEPFERARQGQTSYLENQRMFLTRNGYFEETFFTFSLSPIRDETGKVVGLFHPVTETTSKMLSERRMRALKDLADKTGEAQTVEEACELFTQVVSGHSLDLPFVFLYLLDQSGKTARLVGTTGLKSKVASSLQEVEVNRINKTKEGTDPEKLEKEDQESPWPFSEVLESNQPVQLDGPIKTVNLEGCGPYEEPPHTMLILPLSFAGLSSYPGGFLIVGTSPRLPLDDAYRTYLGMLASSIVTAVNNAGSYEEERRRAHALEEIDRAKTVFFSNVSHEFRTPLTLMLGPIEDMLSGQTLPSQLRSDVEVVHRNAMRLLKLVNNLLDFSRIEANRVQAVFVPVNLALLTADLASAFRAAVERVGIKFTVDLDPSSDPVYVDRDMWEKIVLNLLSNALKYTLKGEIQVRLIKMEDHVEFSVVDTGIGIPEKELPKVFQRFHRVEGAQGRTHEGTGIGLALVSDLTRLLGGKVRVESALGRGSCFTVMLPLGTAHIPKEKLSSVEKIKEDQKDYLLTSMRPDAFVAEQISLISELSESSREFKDKSSPNRRDSRKCILVVDDNDDMRNYVRKLLSNHFEVVQVKNGKEALDAARQRRPDLILSDIMMPVMDGIELLKTLRSDSNLKTLPIILLSARAGDEAKAGGIELGADDYLTKPFSAKELLARVQTQLNMADVRKKAIEKDAIVTSLQRSNQELSNFAFIASHDLKEPLRAISNVAELVVLENEEKLEAAVKKELQRISKLSAHMGILLDSLLNYARSANSELSLEPVDTNGVVQKAVQIFRASNSKNNLQIKIVDTLPRVLGDSAMIGQIFLNLIENGYKYNDQTKKRIEIGFGPVPKTDRSGNPWSFPWSFQMKAFYVKDNGIGIPNARFEDVFRIFKRLHKIGAYGGGTGAGLTIVKKIVERQGGTIWIDSIPGKGTLIYFTLESLESSQKPTN